MARYAYNSPVRRRSPERDAMQIPAIWGYLHQLVVVVKLFLHAKLVLCHCLCCSSTAQLNSGAMRRRLISARLSASRCFACSAIACTRLGAI